MSDIYGYDVMEQTTGKVLKVVYGHAETPSDSGYVALADGSSAVPSLAFSADTNTGIHRPSNGVIAHVSDSVEVLRTTSAGVQVTGLLSGTAVTQTSIDTTTGRLLKVGDFGLGNNGLGVATITDLNTHQVSGSWLFAASTANAPTTAAGVLEHANRASFASTSLAALQRVTTSAGDVYTRTRTNSVWSSWRKDYDQGNLLGTVSLSGGVPTGAVIEAGTNGQGDYLRYADGTQVCRLDFTINVNPTTWTFPMAFATVSRLHVVATAGPASSVRTITTGTLATSNILVRCFDAAGAAAVSDVSCIAFGKWG